MRHPLERKSSMGGASDDCKQEMRFAEPNNKTSKKDLIKNPNLTECIR